MRFVREPKIPLEICLCFSLLPNANWPHRRNPQLDCRWRSLDYTQNVTVIVGSWPVCSGLPATCGSQDGAERTLSRQLTVRRVPGGQALSETGHLHTPAYQLEHAGLEVALRGKDVIWTSCPDRRVGVDRNRLAMALGVGGPVLGCLTALVRVRTMELEQEGHATWENEGGGGVGGGVLAGN